MKIENINEIAEGARVTGIGVAGVTYSFFGMPFAEVAALLTSIFMLIQIYIHLPKIWKVTKDFFTKKKSDEDSG